MMSENRNERIWIYLSDVEFTTEIERHISQDTEAFVKDWKAHERPLSASFKILHKRFILISVDELEYTASGCSIDKQVRFIKDTEKKYNIHLLNRLLVAYLVGEKVEVIPASKIPELLASGKINGEILVLNTAISTTKEFQESWQQPLKQSWLSKYLLKV